jgi:hypothetical protein
MNEDLIRALLLTLQPHRGLHHVTIVAIRELVTRAELTQLERGGYISLDTDDRMHFTSKAYTLLEKRS